jgi:hypothetical protein
MTPNSVSPYLCDRSRKLLTCPTQVLRAVKHGFTSVDTQIQQYSDAFTSLKSKFLGLGAIQTEIMVMRILSILEESNAGQYHVHGFLCPPIDLE